MASVYGESLASIDILTPTMSVSEEATAAETIKQFLSDKNVAAQDDLALGHELLMKDTEVSETAFAHDPTEYAKSQSLREVLPDKTGELVNYHTDHEGY